MPIQIRPFRRDDRDQLTELANAHVQAVVPGMTISTNRVLSQLEREPGEFIVDRWVVARRTLVAEQRGRVTAAVHLLVYGDDPEVGESYRGLGEIRWLLCWPDAPYWPDASAAGRTLTAAAIEVLRRSGATRIAADGALPAPGVYGVPDAWPHIADLLLGADFAPGDAREVVLLADLAQFAGGVPAGGPTVGRLRLRRSLGASGTRFAAELDGRQVGYIEVEIRSADTGLVGGHPGWADIGNLWVDESLRRQGIGRWLIAQASDWLRLGRVDRLLHYVDAADDDELSFGAAVGFRPLTTTTRTWWLTQKTHISAPSARGPIGVPPSLPAEPGE